MRTSQVNQKYRLNRANLMNRVIYAAKFYLNHKTHWKVWRIWKIIENVPCKLCLIVLFSCKLTAQIQSQRGSISPSIVYINISDEYPEYYPDSLESLPSQTIKKTGFHGFQAAIDSQTPAELMANTPLLLYSQSMHSIESIRFIYNIHYCLKSIWNAWNIMNIFKCQMNKYFR